MRTIFRVARVRPSTGAKRLMDTPVHFVRGLVTFAANVHGDSTHEYILLSGIMAENVVTIMENFQVGNRVQAVDDLGRWESGRVIGHGPGSLLKVTFIGWGREWDRDVPPHQCRECVAPLEEQTRSKFLFNNLKKLLFRLFY